MPWSGEPIVGFQLDVWHHEWPEWVAVCESEAVPARVRGGYDECAGRRLSPADDDAQPSRCRPATRKLAVVFPPGVSAGLRGVKLCGEPQAATGACPTESQIGQVTASAGLGGDPYGVETGKAYITPLIAGLIWLPDERIWHGMLIAAAFITVVGAFDDRFELPRLHQRGTTV